MNGQSGSNRLLRFKFCRLCDSHEFTSVYIFIMSCGIVPQRSAKYTLIVTITMKSKFVSCFENTGHGV